MKVKTITNYHDRSEEALFDILNFRSEGGVHLQGISFVKTISLSYGQINVHIIVWRSKSISKVICFSSVSSLDPATAEDARYLYKKPPDTLQKWHL